MVKFTFVQGVFLRRATVLVFQANACAGQEQMRKEEQFRSGRNPAVQSKQRHYHLQSAHSVRALRRNAAAVAVAACFSVAVVNPAQANPTNPTVVSGAAKFTTTGNLLSITNTPSAIINWGSFSIGANEITRFVQQSASSAVLNRVVG